MEFSKNFVRWSILRLEEVLQDDNIYTDFRQLTKDYLSGLKENLSNESYGVALQSFTEWESKYKFTHHSYDGDEYWLECGKLHRDGDKPALIIRSNPNFSTEYWYKNGKLHREGAPALIRSNGYKVWYKEGNQHRMDGPAEIHSKHSEIGDEWYYEGHYIRCSSQEEFERIIRSKNFYQK